MPVIATRIAATRGGPRRRSAAGRAATAGRGRWGRRRTRERGSTCQWRRPGRRCRCGRCWGVRDRAAAGLAVEAIDVALIGDEGIVEHLEGDLTAAACLVAEVDRAHAALAETAEEAVDTQGANSGCGSGGGSSSEGRGGPRGDACPGSRLVFSIGPPSGRMAGRFPSRDTGPCGQTTSDPESPPLG